MYPQHHDIDDMFRRAAARYPLNTHSGDWESVAQKLKVPGKPVALKGYLRGRKYYALLVLIPVAFVFHNSLKYTYSTNPSESAMVTAAKKQPVQQVSKKGVKSVYNHVQAVAEDRLIVATFPKRVAHDLVINIREIPVGATEEKHDQPENIPSVQKGFYLGAGAGIDFGTVKGQGFTGAGSNVSVLLGYRFNKYWSFETGISWITKKYYTSGQHFNMSKIRDDMPGGMEMMAVKGRLSLLEIPYKLKYDFGLKERSNFFVAAGGSTNIYLKENNEYHTLLNGIPEMQKASYRDLHCSPLCLVHVSAGYERIFRNKNKLRLEPYVKFPLRKVGMGSVPVLSVGLNVSVSNFLGGDSH